MGHDSPIPMRSEARPKFRNVSVAHRFWRNDPFKHYLWKHKQFYRPGRNFYGNKYPVADRCDRKQRKNNDIGLGNVIDR